MKTRTILVTVASVVLGATALGVGYVAYKTEQLDERLEQLNKQETTSVSHNQQKTTSQLNPNVEKDLDWNFIKKVVQQKKGELIEVEVGTSAQKTVYEISLKTGKEEWTGVYDAKTKKLLRETKEQENIRQEECVSLKAVKLDPTKALAAAKKEAKGQCIQWSLEKSPVQSAPMYTFVFQNKDGNFNEEIEVDINANDGSVMAKDSDMEYNQEEVEEID